MMSTDRNEFTSRVSLGILFVLCEVMLAVSTFTGFSIQSYDAEFGAALVGIIGIIGTAYAAKLGIKGDLKKVDLSPGAGYKLLAETVDLIILIIAIAIAGLTFSIMPGHELIPLHMEAITIGVGILLSLPQKG